MASPNYPGPPQFTSDAQRQIAELQYRVTQDLVQALYDASAAGLRGYNNRIPKLASAIAISAQNNKAVRETNERIAEKMHSAVKQAFNRRVEGRKRTGSYRIGEGRNAGGALKRAIYHKSMVVGTQRGIEYVNQAKLNQEANHWARLNFGAGAAGAKTVQRKMYELRFGSGGSNKQGTRIKKVGFGKLNGARPPFHMPIGMWVTPGSYNQRSRKGTFVSGVAGRRRFKNAKGQWVGGSAIGDASFVNRNREGNRRGGAGRFRKRSNDEFFPSGKRKFWPKPTIGIRAANFLNDGFAALEKEFPRQYKKLYDTWVKEAKVQARVIKATAPKPKRRGQFGI